MKTLNIGIIGAGRIGMQHADNLLRHSQVKLKAVSDIQPEAIREWSKSVNISTITTDSGQLLQDPQIDAIFICSSTDTHVDFIIEAAKAGKHIFCEKPISFDLRKTEQALEIVKRSGIKMQVGFNRRFDHNFMKVRRLIEEGAIGKPHIVKLISRDPSPPSYDYIKVSGGLLFDMAIHDFDMARFLSGSEVEEVFVKGAVLVDPKIGELGDIDTAVTTLKFKDGTLGIIENSRLAAYGYDQRVEVFGSAGTANTYNDTESTAEWSTAKGVFREKPKHFFLERYQQSYVREVDTFIDCVLNDKPVPVDGYDAYMAEVIAAAAKKSLIDNAPVLIEDIRKLLPSV
ncbi:inositol 2-dehydrogenase [Cohnella herbarum]|uniref:Inositol 2-dehydrogenase n=1 Tax=Cohnella herbarum TaxID=2728023 RepID=A0A7Z2VQ99_9BACL|nr:inositol 2-dehydrogenase [Cohnella herbarum]QJD87264.1 inositol 2-dehydrogenase [Cohnella herbarum]